MGLDAYKYEIVTDPVEIDDLMKDYVESEGYLSLTNDYHVVSRFEFNLFYRNNNRIKDLFEKFSDHIQKYTIKDAYDYDELERRYGALEDFDINNRKYLREEYKSVLEGLRGEPDEDDQNNPDYDIFAIYKNTDGKIHVLLQSDLPTCVVKDDILIFKEVGYCRKTHKQSIYSAFIGDCWYENDNSGLDESDARVFVYGHELDDLKQHFESDSPIQSWDLNDNEVIYISA